MGAWQLPESQTWLTQSDAEAHSCLAPHFEHVELPPQSMPVSAPLLTPSLQVGSWQLPESQTWLTQSDARSA